MERRIQPRHRKRTLGGSRSQSIDDSTAAKSFGVGVLLSGEDPKNLGLTIAAPVILNLILGSKAQHTLTEMKEWLTDNNATVMSVLFAVLTSVWRQA